MIKDNIKEHQGLVANEIDELDNHLKDLPSDIQDLQELNEVISNNKDMSRAYDLGRMEAFEEFKSMLSEIKKNC